MDSPPYRRTGSGANVVFLSSFIPKVSFDGGRTFRPARAPWYEDGYWAFDLQAVPTTGGQSAIMAQSRQAVVDGKVVYGPQLARTDDAGRTWTELTVDLPNFDIAERVVVTPTGRILAASWSRGIGCSEDGGRTWSRLCPTPDTAYAVAWRET